MALLTDPLGPCRTPPHHRLLLLLLGLAWVPQAVQTQQDTTLLNQVLATPDLASRAPGRPLGLTCTALSGLSMERVWELAAALRQKNATLQPDQLRCLARRLMELGVPEDLDAFPPELLPFLNPATLPWPGACAVFSHIAEAHMGKLPAPERRRLLSYALACRGVWGSRVTAADVRALGVLACDLPGRFVASSADVLLPRLAGCPGPLDQDQLEAARAALQGGGPPYGPPSTWSVSTLGALRGLLAALDPAISHSIPKDIISAGLRHTFPDPPRRQPELALVHPRLRRDTQEAACPLGQKPTVVDERLFFYTDWELRACVDGALLDAKMDRVNAIPFTNEQLAILKSKLDEFYPQGYPESLTRRLGYFFLTMKPVDILKWNVTSLDTVLALLHVSRGQEMDAQVAALVSRYLLGRNHLDQELLDALAGFRPTYLCALSPEQLQQVQPGVLWAVGPRDLDACGPRQLGVLYPKALSAFRNVSGPEHFAKILLFLGGASTDDLRALSRENASLDVAAFRRLRAEVVAPLTVAEVRGLLGAHVVELKGAEEDSPVRDWVFRQPQAELDTLQLGLLGGVPDGYLVLDLSFQEAHARAPARLGPGCLLATMPALLLALTPR
ncbi:mesothelin [Lepus europaeus]|uniref:mesothelin n=1 Tax=Lepus europaeus TaxID=9983 RepID=UPI002B45F19F|nr:mesothelin [Lepus europaeus]